MDAFLTALANAQVWQIVVGALVIVAGSSAASAAISSAFAARVASKSFRRDVRGTALTAVGTAYALYLQYGLMPVVRTVDARRDQALAEASAHMYVSVAAVGMTSLLTHCKVFSLTGELFASQNEDTSITELDTDFSNLVAELTLGIPAK